MYSCLAEPSDFKEEKRNQLFSLNIIYRKGMLLQLENNQPIVNASLNVTENQFEMYITSGKLQVHSPV